MNFRNRLAHAGRSAAILGALVALSGCGGAAAKPEEPTVAVVPVARMRLVNSMTFQGELYPYQDVMIHAKVSGYVNPIRVDIGDRVKAGDLLATLEVPELKDQLEGAVAAARRADTEHAIAHLNAQRLLDVNRTQPNLVAQQDLDDAQSKDAATAAAFAMAKADEDRLRTLSAYTRVTAPFNGVITKRFVDNGALVEAGTSSSAGPIVELAENDRLRLRFPVPEAETPGIHLGGLVSVRIDALHSSFEGAIARDAWDIDRSTRTMIVEVDLPNPDGAFKAGMYASVTLPLQVAKDVFAVPLQALSPDDPPSVDVVSTQGRIERRPVSVGMRTASLAEIRSGLSAGERVVVGDRSGLEAGEAVLTRQVDAPDAE